MKKLTSRLSRCDRWPIWQRSYNRLDRIGRLDFRCCAAKLPISGILSAVCRREWSNCFHVSGVLLVQVLHWILEVTIVGPSASIVHVQIFKCCMEFGNHNSGGCHFHGKIIIVAPIVFIWSFFHFLSRNFHRLRNCTTKLSDSFSFSTPFQRNSNVKSQKKIV